MSASECRCYSRFGKKKHRYPSREKALRGAVWSERQGHFDPRKAVSAYPCPRMEGSWHYGSLDAAEVTKRSSDLVERPADEGGD